MFEIIGKPKSTPVAGLTASDVILAPFSKYKISNLLPEKR